MREGINGEQEPRDDLLKREDETEEETLKGDLTSVREREVDVEVKGVIEEQGLEEKVEKLVEAEGCRDDTMRGAEDEAKEEEEGRWKL